MVKLTNHFSRILGLDRQLWVRDYLIEQFEEYCTSHGYQTPSVLFLIASYDGPNANHA